MRVGNHHEAVKCGAPAAEWTCKNFGLAHTCHIDQMKKLATLFVAGRCYEAIEISVQVEQLERT